MDGQELIRLNVQFPASALERLSRLAEQLQKLAAAVSPQPPAAAGAEGERGENTHFDLDRFQKFRMEPDTPVSQAARATKTDIPSAKSVQERVSGSVPTADSAALHADQSVERPPAAGASPGDLERDAETVQTEFQKQEENLQIAGYPENPPMEPPPANHPKEMEELPSVNAPGADADGKAPEAISAGEPEWARPVPVPVSRMEADSGIPDPPGAGQTLTFNPAPPRGRWDRAEPPAAASGPEPLTAEAVSQAIQRDGRRYDSGFPLY